MHIFGKDLLREVTLLDIEALIDTNPYLRGYLQGYLAEMKLISLLQTVDGVESVTKLPDHEAQRGDLRICYKGVILYVEVKSVSSRGTCEDLLRGAWNGRVLNKRTSRKTQRGLLSTHILAGSYDALAISTFCVTGDWTFVFMAQDSLPLKDGDPAFLKTSFVINPLNTPGVIVDPQAFLERVSELKSPHGRINESSPDRRPGHQRPDQLLSEQGLERDRGARQSYFHEPFHSDEGADHQEPC